jgi:hypothetical protein
MSESLGSIATTIKDMTKAVNADDDNPDGLCEDMMSIPSFDDAHLDH